MTSAELRSRAALYRLLAQIYRVELTEALAVGLRDSGTLQLLEDAGYGLGPDDLDQAETRHELAQEYARIFLGPGPHVSPYGSVHHPRDLEKGRLWGSTTKWMNRFVADHGATLEGQRYDGMPDHIGHELEFLAVLIDAQALALDEGRTEEANRLLHSQWLLHNKQLSRWVPTFCAKVREAAHRPFYSEIARLTVDLLEDETDRVAVAG